MMKKSRKKLLALLLLGVAVSLAVGYAVNRIAQPVTPRLPGASLAAQAPKTPALNTTTRSSLAPEAKSVAVTAAEGPGKRLAKLQLEPLPQKGVKAVLPEVGIDPRHPPQWTKALALAPIQVTPPNPFEEPPMAVNPERQPPAPGPRYSAGEFKEVP